MFFLFQGGGDIYTVISGVYIFIQIVERYIGNLEVEAYVNRSE